MNTIKQNHEIITKIHRDDVLKLIEFAGRTCYKSSNKMSIDTATTFVKKIIESEHFSVLEHVNITVKFITDRGVLAELTRHRLCSYSVESTRYCNYSKDKFGNEITLVLPVWFEKDWDWLTNNTGYVTTDQHQNIIKRYDTWYRSCAASEKYYFELLELGQTPQEARSVLPNSLKTEIVITANLREWTHILNLRCSSKAHPQIRALMLPLLKELDEKLPEIFGSLFNKYLNSK